MERNRLIVITGPTASGKSALAVGLALHYGCDIISADSRQIYRGTPIGTAAPTPDQLAAVRHHFVATLPLDAYYSAANFEDDALRLLDDELWQRSPVQIVCGGSMMYIDALIKGIDELPTISPEVRQRCLDMYADVGLDGMLAYLENLDPEYAVIVDRNNPRRVVHAVEICLQSGTTYTSLRKGAVKTRPFDIDIYAIDYSRDELFARINARVDAMIEQGLEDEARALLPQRHLNSLNTVGYKEMFAMFDGLMDRTTAIERIKKNTRVYAKKQLTYLRRLPNIHLLNPHQPLLPQILK